MSWAAGEESKDKPKTNRQWAIEILQAAFKGYPTTRDFCDNEKYAELIAVTEKLLAKQDRTIPQSKDEEDSPTLPAGEMLDLKCDLMAQQANQTTLKQALGKHFDPYLRDSYASYISQMIWNVGQMKQMSANQR